MSAGARLGGRLAKSHTRARHRLPLSVWPVNAAKCDLGVLARRAVTGRDPVLDLVTMSHGVDRQTLELVARTVCQASAPNAQHMGSLRRAGDVRPGD